MTKYQEKTFKAYLEDIEFYNRVNNTLDMDAREISEHYKQLKELRISFFNWFKKQLK
jgi:hypothetical protein